MATVLNGGSLIVVVFVMDVLSEGETGTEAVAKSSAIDVTSGSVTYSLPYVKRTMIEALCGSINCCVCAAAKMLVQVLYRVH